MREEIQKCLATAAAGAVGGAAEVNVSSAVRVDETDARVSAGTGAETAAGRTSAAQTEAAAGAGAASGAGAGAGAGARTGAGTESGAGGKRAATTIEAGAHAEHRRGGFVCTNGRKRCRRRRRKSRSRNGHCGRRGSRRRDLRRHRRRRRRPRTPAPARDVQMLRRARVRGCVDAHVAGAQARRHVRHDLR